MATRGGRVDGIVVVMVNIATHMSCEGASTGIGS